MNKIRTKTGKEYDCESATEYEGKLMMFLPHTGVQECSTVFCNDAETEVLTLVNANGETIAEYRYFTILCHIVQEAYTQVCLRQPRMGELIQANPNEEATND